MADSTPDKVLENRLRRMAARQGYTVRRTRRRDPRAIDYGTYSVLSPAGEVVVEGLTIKQLEEWLD
ncbi:MAG: hypothetical protein QOE23_2222 [Pseudonocardiales bacterium]|jgi:hypothetical protein|nr:hypothetical protein [Pseudonocardiales bacterium]